MKTLKQTAVEWLVEELEDNGIDLDLAFVLVEQAKEMEKQQIIDAFMVGVKNESYRFDTKEQYYNETFKNKNNYDTKRTNFKIN